MEKLPKPLSVFTNLIAFLLCWMSITAVSSYAGVDTSGGSTGTQNRYGEPVAFDLWVNQPNFRDSVPGFELRKFFNMGFIYGNEQILPASIGRVIDQDLYPEILKRINLWSASSPVLTQLLRNTLEEMEFFEIPGSFEVSPDPSIMELPFFKPTLAGRIDRANAEDTFKLSLNGAQTPSILFPVAVFTPLQYGKRMVIYGKAFNLFGRVSQEAVFLKEALRVIQSYRRPQLVSIPGREGKVFAPEVLQMNHATAQMLVYKILLTSPSKGESLDRPEFYSDQLKNAVKLDAKTISQKLDSVCSSWDAVFNSLEFGSMLSEYCKDGRYSSNLFSVATFQDFVSAIRYRVQSECLKRAKSVNDVNSIQSAASRSFEILNEVSDMVGLGILQ